MKSLLLPLLLAAPIAAQVSEPSVMPVQTVPEIATKSVFITGLKEPQGMALDTEKNLLVCDYGSGDVLKFSSDGKALGNLATGLNKPSAIVTRVPFAGEAGRSVPQYVFVSESGEDSVVRIDREGRITPFGQDIVDPILVGGPNGLGLMVVSHATSKIYRWHNPNALSNIPTVGGLFLGREMVTVDPKGKWELHYSAPSTKGALYGFRWSATDGSTCFVSDDVGKRILMIDQNSRLATFATGISVPSGIVIGPDKMVYVANEGDGGQLIRVNAEGEKTIVSEGLGRPHTLVFLDAKTLLVSNRDGNVWKVVLP